MNLDDWQLVFVSVCLILVLAAFATIAMAFFQRKGESFFCLAILGDEDMAENYYPDDDPQIELGEKIHWNIYLYNHMGEVQYILLKIKLLNSSALSPNSTTCNPSPSHVIYEVRHVLMSNTTWLFPFNWSIENVKVVNDYTQIENLMINGSPINTQIIAERNQIFRFVFELWVYDYNFQDFRVFV